MQGVCCKFSLGKEQFKEVYKNKLGQRLYTSIVEISMHDTVMDYVVHFCCDLFSLCLWVNCLNKGSTEICEICLMCAL